MSGAERTVSSVIGPTTGGAMMQPREQHPLKVLQIDPLAFLQLGPLGLTLLRQRATIAA